MTTKETLKDILNKVSNLDRLLNAPTQEHETDRLLQFTKKEIDKMPNKFKKIFRTNGYTAWIRRRSDDRYKCSYEVRYRRSGYNISVSGKTIEIAKQRFIDALNNAEPKEKSADKGIPTTFNEFAQYYFNTFRWRKVVEITRQTDTRRYNAYILPAFNDKAIKNITPGECQKLIDSIFEKGTPKQATEVFSLLNQIFKMAIKHNIIVHNPCDIVFVQKYEKQHGETLTKDEERELLKATSGTPYLLMFAIALYTGLRPNEYKTARIDGKFIIANNSKQKDGKEHIKRIPITPMLAPYLENVSEIKFYHLNRLRDKLKEFLPNHKLYDLRTTFYTRCQECGVTDIARNLFVGHSLGGLADTYTDISDEYLLKESAKLNY